MIIRKLTDNDAPKLFCLIDAIETDLPNRMFWLPIKDEAKIHFFDDGWTEFYGMFVGEELVGASALFYNEFEYGESLRHLHTERRRVAEIGRSMVHPAYRGNNFLYQINLQLLQVAKSKGIELLLATIHPDNMPSQKSFQKLGMEKQCTYTKSNGFVRDVFTLLL